MFANKLTNYINGEWIAPKNTLYQAIVNPATQETLSAVPLSSKADVEMAVQAATEAGVEWRRVPSADRVKGLLAILS